MAAFRTLDDIGDVRGRRVLVRVDLNVPMKGGKVTDATRIERVAPTVLELAGAGARVILLAHFGRPEGVPSAEFSLRPVAEAAGAIIGREVAFANDCIGGEAAEAVGLLSDGDILVLENTRFHEGEEKNDPAFAKALAENGDLYVNDAFSAAHRAHASTVGVARILPAFAGRAMQAELDALEKGLGNPARPVVAIVGGAKVSSKLDLLMNLVRKVDALVIGGGMANTFLAARGDDVGRSLCEHDLADTARQIMIEAAAAGCAVVLPSDAVVASEFKVGAASRTVPTSSVPADSMILDVGPKTLEMVTGWIDRAATVVWNGPLGAPGRESWFRWPAAATPSRPSTWPARPTASPMSRRPAAPSSNGWRARTCPASRRSARPAAEHRAGGARRVHRPGRALPRHSQGGADLLFAAPARPRRMR